MGFGDTAKKISQLTTKAESIYTIAKDLHEKLTALREEINEMRESMRTLDEEMVSQSEDIDDLRVLVEGLAAEQGLDPEELLREAAESDDHSDQSNVSEPRDSEQVSTDDDGSNPDNG